MCDSDDGFDVDDAAFWGGFVETQIEGEKEDYQQKDPSPEDLLENDTDKLLDPESRDYELPK